MLSQSFWRAHSINWLSSDKMKKIKLLTEFNFIKLFNQNLIVSKHIGKQQKHFEKILPLLIQQTTYQIVEARKADQENLLSLLQWFQNSISEVFKTLLLFSI
jgi:hypothetical protein